MEVNKFTDLTDTEFAAMYLTLKMPLKDAKAVKLEENTVLNSKLKGGTVDWVAAGMVTLVKDQGACGSGWAFSATGAIESASLIKDRSTDILSEQDLIDCSKAYGNAGCSGGWVTSAYRYIADKGIAS